MCRERDDGFFSVTAARLIRNGHCDSEIHDRAHKSDFLNFRSKSHLHHLTLLVAFKSCIVHTYIISVESLRFH